MTTQSETMPEPETTIRAPWTPEQVAALNAFQQRGGMHPFTCGNEQHDTHYVLIARADGWHCSAPPCDYRQDWAHAFMANPQAWPHLFPRGRAEAGGHTSSSATINDLPPLPAALKAAPTTDQRCSCGGQGITHLHADQHDPAPAPPVPGLRDQLCDAFIRLIRDYADRSIIAPRYMADTALAVVQPVIDEARATNQRLNYRAQTAESRLNQVTVAVAEWQVDDRGTYVPMRTLNAIAKAVGIHHDTSRWELHYQHVQALEAALARARKLHQQYTFGGNPQDYCAHCNSMTGGWIPWPCPTIAALAPPVPADGPEGGAQ